MEPNHAQTLYRLTTFHLVCDWPKLCQEPLNSSCSAENHPLPRPWTPRPPPTGRMVSTIWPRNPR